MILSSRQRQLIENDPMTNLWLKNASKSWVFWGEPDCLATVGTTLSLLDLFSLLRVLGSKGVAVAAHRVLAHRDVRLHAVSRRNRRGYYECQKPIMFAWLWPRMTPPKDCWLWYYLRLQGSHAANEAFYCVVRWCWRGGGGWRCMLQDAWNHGATTVISLSQQRWLRRTFDTY